MPASEGEDPKEQEEWGQIQGGWKGFTSDFLLYWLTVEGVRRGRGALALAGTGISSHSLSDQALHTQPRVWSYHNHLCRDGEADLVHVASVELLHQHQEGTTNEGEDERGDVGVGEVFANVNEGLVERASCLWAPTASSPTTPTTGWLTPCRGIISAHGGTKAECRP